MNDNTSLAIVPPTDQPDNPPSPKAGKVRNGMKYLKDQLQNAHPENRWARIEALGKAMWFRQSEANTKKARRAVSKLDKEFLKEDLVLLARKGGSYGAITHVKIYQPGQTALEDALARAKIYDWQQKSEVSFERAQQLYNLIGLPAPTLPTGT